MIAKVKFTDGETRTYHSVRRMKLVSDFVVLLRWRGRKVAIAGREVKWVQLGKEIKVYQKDFTKGGVPPL